MSVRLYRNARKRWLFTAMGSEMSPKAAYTDLDRLCTMLETSWKISFSSLQPRKRDIQTNSVPKHKTCLCINFCGTVDGSERFCIALSAPQQSKTIKPRETFCFFTRIKHKLSKNNDETMNTYLNEICVFRRWGRWKCSKLDANTYLSVDIYELYRPFLNTMSLLSNDVKKRVETVFLMVNLDHLKPTTQEFVYKPWHWIYVTIAAESAWLCIAGLRDFEADHAFRRISVQTHFQWYSHRKRSEIGLIRIRVQVCTGEVSSCVRRHFTAVRTKKLQNCMGPC